MITFGIGLFGHEKDVQGTEFHTEPATFAAFIDDVNYPAGNFDSILIKGLSPIFHNSSLMPNARGSRLVSPVYFTSRFNRQIPSSNFNAKLALYFSITIVKKIFSTRIQAHIKMLQR